MLRQNLELNKVFLYKKNKDTMMIPLMNQCNFHRLININLKVIVKIILIMIKVVVVINFQMVYYLSIIIIIINKITSEGRLV